MTNEEMQNKILELEARLNALSDYSTVPLNVGNALKARILPSNFTSGRFVAGTPSVQAVNEAGIGVYNVQAPLSGKIGITIGNTEYIVPTI